MTAINFPPTSFAPPAPRWRTPFGLGVLLAGNLALITGLWFAHDGWPSAGSAPDRFTAVGQLLALYGTFAALVQVLMVARVPGLDGRFGMDRLTRWHRWTGFALTWGVLGHMVFSTIGWSSADGHSVVGEFLHLNASELTILLATVATVFLAVVAVSSVRIARRRVAYESWFYVHLLAYAMLVLSFPHIVTLGSDFDHHKWNTRYWVLLYGLTIGAVLVHRVGNPLRNAVRHGFRLSAITPEAPGVVSLHLTGRSLDRFPVRAGQFVIARFGTKGWRHKAHPFSVSGFTDSSLRLTVKELGDDTGRARDLPIGSRVLLEGPYGAFTETKRTRRKVLLVAGGIGITPLRVLFEKLHGDPGDVTLLYRSRTDDDIVFRNELDGIARERGFEVHYATGSREEQAAFLEAGQLTRLVPDVSERDVFLCGPADLVEAAKHGLRAAGVPRRHIHHENFAF